MLIRTVVVALVCVLLAVAAADETRKFPKANLVKSEVVEKAIMGKSFLPGGTLVHYRKGKLEYTMFAAKAATPTAAAIALSDYRKALKNPKLIASFGGYFGDEGGKPTFVFTKGSWVLGIQGLELKEADPQARVLAGQF